MKLWKSNFKDKEKFDIDYKCIPKGLALDFEVEVIDFDAEIEYD